MRKRKFLMLSLTVIMVFALALPMFASERYEQGFINSELEMELEIYTSTGPIAVTFGTQLLPLLNDELEPIVHNCEHDNEYEGISPFQEFCCNRIYVVVDRVPLYSGGIQVGWGYIRQCRGCGAAWPWI